MREALDRHIRAAWERWRALSPGWLLLLPSALLMAAFYLMPIARILWVSVTEPSPGLGNYQLLLTDAGIARVLATTVRVSLTTTAISVTLAYIVAYALLQASPGHRRLMLIFVILPFWISVLVRAFAWMILLGRIGAVNELLQASGLTTAPLELMYNELGVDIGMVHYMVPVATLTLYANMRGIEERLVLAARGLGASRAQAFSRVFLPLSLPGVVAASILVFVFSTGFFVTPALLGGGKTLMAAEYITVLINETVRWGLATMLATTLLAAIFALMGMLAGVFDLRRLFGGAQP
jgi:putative spermidine/putrescine transport system permease protein